MSMRHQAGFTLLEILVALAVFALGLLGLASLQMVGQRNTQSAYLRSQAVLQVYDMADRMRANPQGLTEYNGISTIKPTDPDCMGDDEGCDPNEIAAYDAIEWITQNETLLPLGQGSVSFIAARGTYRIAVAWDDNRDGIVDLDNSDPQFSLEFRP